MSEPEDIVYDAKYVGWDVTDAYRAKVRPDIAAQVDALSNAHLLYHYTYFAGGDDYDGAHSTGGKVVWEELQREFTRRLAACGFLKVEDL